MSEFRQLMEQPSRPQVNHVTRSFRLRLLGGWELESSGGAAPASPGARRLLGLLALRGRQLRVPVSATLWPDSPDRQAAGSLRELLWRVKNHYDGLIEVCQDSLQLDGRVEVDVNRLTCGVQEMATSSAIPSDGVRGLLTKGELLPTWQDDWVVPAREYVRETQLRGLEILAKRYLDVGLPDEALAVAMAVVRLDALRESGHRAVLSAHLAIGNYGPAMMHFERLTEHFLRELGVPPSRDMAELLRRDRGNQIRGTASSGRI